MKFKRKPVIIEALQWNGSEDRLDEILKFAKGFVISCVGQELAIYTLEGRMIANNGDWIIKGIKGEFYPCKPDIFEASYDRVNND